MNREILCGDVLEKLQKIPDSSIDVIVTSPPYLNQRDYNIKGQIGLAEDHTEYLEKLKKIMEQCHRVLKDTGTVWVNLGDSYANKTLIGIPERFYIDCIDAGWLARNNIPWVKGNPMPDPTKDRFTNVHESVFFFAKNQKYYFNLDNVREQTITPSIAKKISKPAGVQQTIDDTTIQKKKNKQDTVVGSDGKVKRNYAGFNERYNTQHRKSAQISMPNGNVPTMNLRHSGVFDIETGKSLNHPNGKNPGDVFYINTKPSPIMHHAMFPVELPKRILSCACPPDVCKKCGIPQMSVKLKQEKTSYSLSDFEKMNVDTDNLTTSIICDIVGVNPKAVCSICGRSYKRHASTVRGKSSHRNYPVFALCNNSQMELDKCQCNAGFESGIVLDIFMGGGTTAVAAEELGLKWMGIELNEAYIRDARERLEKYLNRKVAI